jgi:hypothetical protein
MATNWTNVSNMNEVLAVANANSGSWFWTLILYGVWIILLILFSALGWEVTILTASTIALIFGLLLAYAGLVGFAWVLTFLGAILFTILYLVWTANKQ